ncbi:MAG: ATP-dependent DNA ligase [Thaumarchaeota archaeon]|nr:ATP-dependent DNA ligase [Nitrososphaerota archaeon]
MRSSSKFADLAQTLEAVRGTRSKNQKVDAFAAYLSKLDADDAEEAARMAVGTSSERGSKDEVQVGYSTVFTVLKGITGASSDDVSKTYLKYGDLGEVAEELLRAKRERPLFEEPLTIAGVSDSFGRLRSAKGKGSGATREALVKSLLLRATPLEGKYIVKVMTREMRTGLVSGMMEGAIAAAFGSSKEETAKAHMLLGDVGLLAKAASRKQLGSVRMEPFRPVNFMLAEPLASAEEVASHFGEAAYAEYKYDGVRAQVHKKGDEVRVYSRRLEDISAFFPEVTRGAAGSAYDFILDGEIVPYSGGKPLPFQLLQRRLRRMVNFSEAAKNAPVEYFAFDLLYEGDREVVELTLRERRKLLDQVRAGTTLRTAESSTVEGAGEISKLFRKSRDLGYEGLVLKSPGSQYTMGKRGSAWVKMKEELDTIDAVIVAAEYGHGKRAGVISDYTFAVRDGDELKTIGKAYSGLTDAEIDEMTARMKEITVHDYGYTRKVKPEVVIEVAFDSIQRSDRHDSGYALRFPRIKRIRADKSVGQADTIEKVEKTFAGQRLKVDRASG